MAHEWDRGVLASSSWHQLETLGNMSTAADIIAHGETSGAWPTALFYAALVARSEDGPELTVPGLEAIVGAYQSHADRVLGVVGGRYRETTPDEWRSLVSAAVDAGAKPTGAFSLREGKRVLATFEVGSGSGIVDHLVLADSFDGSLRLTAGTSSVRVVCANTLSAAMSSDGAHMARLRHTASLETRINALRDAIGDAVKTGSKVRAMFEAASSTVLNKARAKAAFDAMFPEAPEDATLVAKTRAENTRHAARIAAAMPINKVGSTPGNLATLWNAATYLVDRREDGTYRSARGDADGLDSMLFGARAKQVAEIQTMVEVLMADGTSQAMSVPQAADAGALVPGEGRILDMMLDR